jgi:hypothetical protein
MEEYFMRICRLVPVAVLAVAVLAIRAPSQEKSGANRAVSDRELVSWVEKVVQQRQPPAADKRFDEIGWARDIRQALQLAKKHQRPVFLFTHDGRMNLGRC